LVAVLSKNSRNLANLAMQKCPTCLETRHKLLYTLDLGKLLTCQNCRLVFYIPRPTSEELAAFYDRQSYRQDYEKSIMAGKDFANNRYRELKKIITKYKPDVFSKTERKFLDIGCGLGDLLELAIADGWQVTGTEISPKAAIQANKTLEGKVLIGDILSLDLPENSFDLITIYHVIEHLVDPIPTLEKIRALLKPDGIAFIETPNIGSLGAKIKGKKWSHIIPPEHITYFDNQSLKYALRTTKFTKFEVFSSAPYKIESIANWIQLSQSIVTLIYQTVPILGLGAALQAVAFK
jgi:2-polyprenyl-3-methyl-5-hydroxy-6-metoxy-1,4-benzoquinol methylase